MRMRKTVRGHWCISNPRSNLLCLILQSTCISTHIDPLYLRLIPSLFVVHPDFTKTSTFILSTVKLKNVQSDPIRSDPIRSSFSVSTKIESSPLDSSGSPLFYFCFLFSLLSSFFPKNNFFPPWKKTFPWNDFFIYLCSGLQILEGWSFHHFHGCPKKPWNLGPPPLLSFYLENVNDRNKDLDKQRNNTSAANIMRKKEVNRSKFCDSAEW